VANELKERKAVSQYKQNNSHHFTGISSRSGSVNRDVRSTYDHFHSKNHTFSVMTRRIFSINMTRRIFSITLVVLRHLLHPLP